MISIPRSIFLILSLFGITGTWIAFALNNGLTQSYTDHLAIGQYPFNVQAPTSFTGQRVVDQSIMSMPLFFFTILHGSFPEGRLWNVVFFGNIPILVAVLYVNSTRVGAANSGQSSEYLYSWLGLSQAATAGATFPLYFYFDLSSKDLAKTSANTYPSDAQTLALIPSIIVSLGAPVYLMFDTQQIPNNAIIWIMAFVLYPVTMAVCQSVFTPLLGLIFSSTSDTIDVRRQSSKPSSRPTTFVYLLFTLVAADCHIYGAVGLTRNHDWILALSPWAWSFSGSPEQSLAKKMLLFIWTDETAAFLAFTLWTLARTSERLEMMYNKFTLIAGFVVGYVAIGPGATCGLAWIFYENMGDVLDKQKAA